MNKFNALENFNSKHKDEYLDSLIYYFNLLDELNLLIENEKLDEATNKANSFLINESFVITGIRIVEITHILNMYSSSNYSKNTENYLRFNRNEIENEIEPIIEDLSILVEKYFINYFTIV